MEERRENVIHSAETGKQLSPNGKKRSGIPDGLSIQVQEEIPPPLDGHPQALICIKCRQVFTVPANILESRVVEYCIPCYRTSVIRMSQDKIVFRPNHIIHHIYLGGARTAENLSVLQELNITRVLVIGTGLTCHFPEALTYHHISLEDQDEENIAQHFLPAIDFIDKAPDNVLVHCYAGVSRSASLVIAYIMFKQRVALSEAVKIVKAKRSCISPNFGFMLQLKDFEKFLLEAANSEEKADKCC